MAWNEDTKKLVVKFLEAIENTMINRPEPKYGSEEWVIAFNELKQYVEDDYIHWAYKLGLKLDEHIPWCGVNNRERIERAIDGWLKLKKSKKPQVSKKWVEKWYEAILMNSGAITDEFGVRRQIYLMLKEAGVEVVGKQ